MKKSNLELATEIVITMINTGRIDTDKSNHLITNECVVKALETVFNKLEELSKNNNSSSSYEQL